jgi:hypothetical protein
MNAEKNAQDTRPDARNARERYSALLIVVPVILLALLFALPILRGAYARFHANGAWKVAGAEAAEAAEAAAEPWSEAWLAENPQLPAQQRQGSIAIISEKGTLMPGDDDFMSYYELLYKDKERYYGRSIELAGIVMRDDSLGGGAFLIGRSLIWCCEDDADFVGYLAFGADPLPEDGATLRISGLLERRLYTDAERGRTFDVPAIRIRALAPAQDFSPAVYPVSTSLFGY